MNGETIPDVPGRWPAETGGGTCEDCRVYVSYTRVDTTTSPVENAAIVAEEMLGWLRDIDGFEGFLMLQGETTAVGLTFWESRDVAERHRVARMQFVERMSSVAGVQIEERLEFEVAFAALGQRLASFSS